MPHALIYHTIERTTKTKRIMGAVASGLCTRGWTTEMRESTTYPLGDEHNADGIAIWGNFHGTLRIIQDTPYRPWTLFYLDNGYLCRGHYDGYYSVTCNMAQIDGQQALWKGSCPSIDRWERLQKTIAPWRTTGKSILVLGQSRKQCRRLGLDYPSVNEELLSFCQHATQRPIRYEKKLASRPFNLRQVCQSGEIALVLARTSKGLVEALLEGVPVYATQSCICAGRMSVQSIDHPYYVEDNRLEFFQRLAYHQWTLDEIAEGQPSLFQPYYG